MKELSQQSLHKIRDVIPGQNYANIKARLDQHLPTEYSSMFAKVNFASDNGLWFGDDDVDYKPYATASAAEKEEIAVALEECKAYAGTALKSGMPYIDKVFIVPSTDVIFWSRDKSGAMKVLLTQWGFQRKQLGQNVDIIDMLIGAPRTMTQEDVVVDFRYSDGETAPDMPFKLAIFNNVKECVADGNGQYRLGKLHANKKFSIEDLAGKQQFDFTVGQGSSYVVTFDYPVKYRVIVENQEGAAKPGFKILIDGKEATTDEKGEHLSEDVILTPGRQVSVSLPDGSGAIDYPLSRNEDDNTFKYVITEKKEEEVKPDDTNPEPPRPPLPPEPPRFVTIHLLDLDGAPLSNIPFKVIAKGMKDIDCVTDSDGAGKFPAELLKPGKRYRVKFSITPQQRAILDNRKKQTNGHE